MPPLDPPLEPTDPADPHALPRDPVDAEFSEDEIELAYQRALAAFSDHETPDEFVPEDSDGEDSDGEESDSEESALDPSESSEPDPSGPNEWAHTAADAESREEPALADAFASDAFAADDFASDDFASAAEVPDEDAASESYPEDSSPDNGFDADAAEHAAAAQDVVDQDWIAEDPGAEEACAAASEATTSEDEAAFAQSEDDVGDSDRESGADATWAEAGEDVATAAEAEAAAEADAEVDAGDEPSLTADTAVDFALAADVSPGEPTLDAHVDPEPAHLSIEDARSDSEAAHVEDHSFAEASPEALHAESCDDTLDDSLDVVNGDAQPVPPELALGNDEPEADEPEADEGEADEGEADEGESNSGEVAEFADELPELALPDLSRLEAELVAAGVELADPEPPPEALASAPADLADESPAPHLAAPLTEAGARGGEQAVAAEPGPDDSAAVLPVAGEPAGSMGLDAATVAAASAAIENPPEARAAPGNTARGRRASSTAPASEPQVTWRGDAAHGDRSSSLRGPRGVASDRFTPPPPTSAETITPAQVIEGALFVGGGPLSAGKLYALLRGTIALEDVPELIDDLNHLYASQNRPYEIRLGDGGYVLDLCPDYEKLRHRVFGQGPREVRLTQDQLEVLALVAYRQPISEAGIAALGRPEAGNVLRQLLRRELVGLERGEQGPKDVTYHTTERFLSVFGLASLAELPQPEDLAAR